MASPKKNTNHKTQIIVGVIAAIAAIVVSAIKLIPPLMRHETKQVPPISDSRPIVETPISNSHPATGHGKSNGDATSTLVASSPSSPAAPTPVTSTFGPFGVCKSSVETNIQVMKSDKVRVVSTGTVDFGGAVLGIGAPILDANGDNNDRGAPNDYPAPALMKNSLICKVQSHWYQGGTEKSFIADENGQLVLLCNDAHREDNSRGWQVTVYVTH